MTTFDSYIAGEMVTLREAKYKEITFFIRRSLSGDIRVRWKRN